MHRHQLNEYRNYLNVAALHQNQYELAFLNIKEK